MSDDDETCLFVVIASHEVPSRWSRPYFVRAKNLAAAYADLITNNQQMFDHPHIRLEGFVIEAGEVPDMKRIAKAWWTLAYQSANDPNRGSLEDFEKLWDEYGADPEED